MLGKLIVFEGVEGCGKTTQIQKTYFWLLEKMRSQITTEDGVLFAIKQDVTKKNITWNAENWLLMTRQPGGTELGLQLRELLLHNNLQEKICSRSELLLYAADRAQHIENFVKPHLAKGAIILCDRYTDSTVAYQGYGRGLDLSLINNLNYIATDGLESNLTLWLDVDVKIGLARTKQRGKTDLMEQTNLEFHQRVQAGYRELAKLYPHRIIRIDASRSQIEVQQEIQRILSKYLSISS